MQKPEYTNTYQVVFYEISFVVLLTTFFSNSVL